MKRLTVALLLLLNLQQMSAATLYAVAGGTDNNWGTTGANSNWSLTDGGPGGQAVPTASDDLKFTALSPSMTINASSRVAKSIDATGYLGTLTPMQQLTVSGSVTWGSAMTFGAGSGALIVNANGTLTANGKTWPNAMTLCGTSTTITVTDSWGVAGLLTLSGVTAQTINGPGALVLQNGIHYTPSGLAVTGTALIKMVGTGTVDAPSQSGSGTVQLPMEIDTTGTITVSGRYMLDLNNITYVKGTVNTIRGTWGAAMAGSSQVAYPGGN